MTQQDNKYNNHQSELDAVLDSETQQLSLLNSAILSSDLLRQGKWSKEEDDMLQTAIDKHGEKQWRKISDEIPGRSAIQCLHRWTKILKPGLVKGPWTVEEDQKLTEWVQTEGPTKWAQASAFIKGRNGKQCRERWFNNLNPALKKGPWTEQEDEIIFKMYQTVGSCWSKIAKALPGRTENSIKNRFYSTIRKLATSKKKAVDLNIKDESNCTADLISTDALAQNANTVNHLYKLLADKSIEVVKKPNDSSKSESAKEKRKRRNKAKRLQAAQNKLVKASSSLIKEEAGLSKQESSISTAESNKTNTSDMYNNSPMLNHHEEYKPVPVQQVQQNQSQNSQIDVNTLTNASMDQKMSVLLEKLASLENMLFSTRKELVSLEKTMSDEEINKYKNLSLPGQDQHFDLGFHPNSNLYEEPIINNTNYHNQAHYDDLYYGQQPHKQLKLEENNCLLQDDFNNSQIFNICDDYLINFHQ